MRLAAVHLPERLVKLAHVAEIVLFAHRLPVNLQHGLEKQSVQNDDVEAAQSGGDVGQRARQVDVGAQAQQRRLSRASIRGERRPVAFRVRERGAKS